MFEDFPLPTDTRVYSNVGKPADVPCYRCGSEVEVLWESSRTCYDTSKIRTRFERVIKPEPDDPNAPVPLCRECAVEHHEFWDECWSEYYSGVR